jgi:hypothetical protein
VPPEKDKSQDNSTLEHKYSVLRGAYDPTVVGCAPCYDLIKYRNLLTLIVSIRNNPLPPCTYSTTQHVPAEQITSESAFMLSVCICTVVQSPALGSRFGGTVLAVAGGGSSRCARAGDSAGGRGGRRRHVDGSAERARSAPRGGRTPRAHDEGEPSACSPRANSDRGGGRTGRGVGAGGECSSGSATRGLRPRGVATRLPAGRPQCRVGSTGPSAVGPGPIHQSILMVDFAAATHFDKRFRAEAGVEVVDDPITVKIVRRRHRRRRHQPRPAGSGRQAAA